MALTPRTLAARKRHTGLDHALTRVWEPPPPAGRGVHTAHMPVDAEARAAAPEPAPLVETKLVPPRVRPNILVRARLERLLDRSSSAALTLVDAPVGFGKTMLVQSWCANQSVAAVAWVSLDAADDDPARFWTYLATAIDRIRPGLGRTALRRLRTPGASIPAAVDELANALAGYGAPVAIVLDDLHALSSEASFSSLEYVVAHLPSNARIIATTRVDPPIGLARLRARGMLAEIRSRELAFTVEETRAFLVDAEGMALADVDVEQLVGRTEGWPAGLYLAALWLRGLDDPGAGVRGFAGDHRHVAEYLTGEVLDALDPRQRDFLLRSSVLDRFTAELCDDVLGRTDSAAMLAEIERSNLFLVALDPRGEWFRYHHLFADLLQLERGDSDPAAVVEPRRRAAAWFRERGLIAEAAEHAAAAGDEAMVADMLFENASALLRSGRAATLLRWTETLSEELLLERPVVAAGGAIAAGLLGRPAAERQRLLALAERSRTERPERWIPLAEAGYWIVRAGWMDGNVGGTVTSAQRALEVTRGTETELPCIACLAYALFLAGDRAGAREQAERAIGRDDAAIRPIGMIEALATLALIEAGDGRTNEAETRAREALDVARATGLEDGWMGGLARLALATALAGAGRLAEAEAAAERAERIRRTAEPTVENAQARLALASIRVARGRLSQAAADIADARSAMAGFVDAGSLPVVAERAEQALEAAEAVRVHSTPAEAPSAAELTVLQLLPTQLSQREIGAELFLSLNTVKTHTRELYRKLGVRSREEAVARAAELGLLDATS
jgi:LuxR family maltose regulon positive regulatory protein